MYFACVLVIKYKVLIHLFNGMVSAEWNQINNVKNILLFINILPREIWVRHQYNLTKVTLFILKLKIGLSKIHSIRLLNRQLISSIIVTIVKTINGPSLYCKCYTFVFLFGEKDGVWVDWGGVFAGVDGFILFDTLINILTNIKNQVIWFTVFCKLYFKVLFVFFNEFVEFVENLFFRPI